MPDDDALDRLLAHLDELDARGDDDDLRAELVRGLAVFPGASALRAWQASLAVDDERFEDALAILDDLVAGDPADESALRERAAVLIDLGRFADALAALRALPGDALRRFERAERAAVHADVALCLDRLGRIAEADAEFRHAARLAPKDFPVPPRLSAERFEALVAEALDRIPRRFRSLLDQVVVTCRDYPDPDDPDPFLLGLYVGIPRDARTLASAEHLDHVVVYKRAHELCCRDEAALRDEVRSTLVHELAHHFGVDHDDMGEYR
jgi:predicted Zn-dependent protease with MMP-like domain